MGCNQSTVSSPHATSKSSATVNPTSSDKEKKSQQSSLNRSGSFAVGKVPESAPVKELLVNAWNEDAGNALRLLLKNSGKIRKHFETFLKEQYSDEHVEFLVAVENLSRLHQESLVNPQQAWEYAKVIFDKHIQPGSVAEVNLSARTRKNEFTVENYRDYLAKAEEEIIQMLSLDLFPRFLQSKHCEMMLEDLAVLATGAHKEITYGTNTDGSSIYINNKDMTDNTGNNNKPDSDPIDDPTVVNENKLLQSINKAKSTARKSAGIWLEAFESVANLLPSSIVVADMSVPGAPLIYVNKDFMKMTGYSQKEIYGHNCRFLQGPKTDPETIQKLRDAIKNRQEVSCEILNYRKNGEEFRNYLTLRPVFWPENNGGSVSGGGSGGSSTFLTGLAYFIGVQYEITDDSLMVQRLLHHEAILRMLPSHVML